MKNIKPSAVLLPIFISCTIIMQSCIVYSRRIAPEEAIGKGPVYVVNNHGDSFEFKSLALDNGKIVGVKKSGGSIKYKEIPGGINYVKTKDRTASTILTTVAIIIGGISIFVIPKAVDNIEVPYFGEFGGWGYSCFDPRDNRPVLPR